MFGENNSTSPIKSVSRPKKQIRDGNSHFPMHLLPTTRIRSEIDTPPQKEKWDGRPERRLATSKQQIGEAKVPLKLIVTSDAHKPHRIDPAPTNVSDCLGFAWRGVLAPIRVSSPRNPSFVGSRT
jgi:hypothetical protein